MLNYNFEKPHVNSNANSNAKLLPLYKEKSAGKAINGCVCTAPARVLRRQEHGVSLYGSVRSSILCAQKWIMDLIN